jgi:hypothetical protein
MTLGNATPLANAEAGYVPIPRLPQGGILILDQSRPEIAADDDNLLFSVVLRRKAMKGLKHFLY